MNQSVDLPTTIQDWTPDQFKALLLLHAAHADLDYSFDERLKILDCISEDDLCVLESYYRTKTDPQVLQIVLNHKAQFLNTYVSRKLILQDIKGVFEADGEISKLEQTQYEFLSRLLMDSES